MNYIVRKKQKEDCFELAHLITIVWNETYKEIVPDDFLNNLYLNEKERAKKSYDKFNEVENHQYVLVVDNKVVGFINVGKSDETEYNNCGEIHALYIIKEYQGNGFSKLLIDAGIKELKKLGCNKMIIGCLVGNPSNKFYEHIGGKLVKQRVFKKLGLLENVYYFDKI